MQVEFLAKKKLPFCPGCGHHASNLNLAKALEKAGYNPMEVVVVSDIGCSGLIDESMATHTVHGLHGRVVALATGISYGLGKDKKVIAVQGDGGATIGLQHLLVSARRNVNLTVLILNNMVYGMTGGQLSGLSDVQLKKEIMEDESHYLPFDISQMAFDAGAMYASRIIGRGEFSDKLTAAIRIKGFSLVEIVEPCPVYAYPSTKELVDLGYMERVLTREQTYFKPAFTVKPSLFDKKVPPATILDSTLKERVHILIGGSAGEGVQLAGDFLAKAGLNCGLHATKKGEYPITVGTGFSLAEVILSKEEINYTGIEKADVAIVASVDGWNMVKSRINANTLVVIDESIEVEANEHFIRKPFRDKAGRKSAVLSAIAFWLAQSHALPLDALAGAFAGHKHAEKLSEAVKAGIDLY
jgi:2-oxoglutarate/2-oxoacid ferredoxin oxidoreductase subunit beta